MNDPSVQTAISSAPQLACPISRELLPWLIAGLRGEFTADDEQATATWPGEKDDQPQSLTAPLADWRWGGPAMERVRQAFAESAAEIHSQPLGQPSRVHEISPALLAPYQAENGRVRLGGCTLEWIPVWRSVAAVSAGEENGDSPTSIEIRIAGASGESLEPEEREALESLALTLLSTAPADSVPPPEQDEPALLRFPIWRSWVRGRVMAEIGEQTLAADVEGWASEIVGGQVQPPPFDIGCGQPSYRAAVDDDGDIGPDTAMTECAESKKRLLCSKMQRCGSSEVWVDPKHVSPCPVTGVGVRASELIECNMCRQPVAPQAISGGRCEVCRNLTAVAKEDAQVARIIGEFPTLDRWSAWKIGESRDCWVLTAGRFLWRLLVVVKKEPLELARAATGLRWIRGWTEAPEELLRELRDTP